MQAQCFVHPNPPRGQNLTKTCGLAQPDADQRPRINENMLFANPDAHERPTSYENNWFSLTRSLQEAKHFWKKHTVFAQPETPERPKSSESIWLLLVQTPPKSQKYVKTYGFAHPEAPRKHCAGTAGVPAQPPESTLDLPCLTTNKTLQRRRESGTDTVRNYVVNNVRLRVCVCCHAL